MVNRDRIYVDLSKVESDKNWKTPESPTKIRSFLGLAGYYRRFIENFSKIAKPLTLLTQKNKAYVWGDKQDEPFQILKEKLCNAPVLALPDGPDDFVVYCDASTKQRFWGAIGLERHFEQRDDGEIYFFDRIWIPSVGGVRKLIMDEAHTSRYSVHPGVDKMYYDLRDLYWWPGIKRDIAETMMVVFTSTLARFSGRYWVETRLEYGYQPSSPTVKVSVTIIHLEAMLRASCYGFWWASWDTHLPLIESPLNMDWNPMLEKVSLLDQEIVQEKTKTEMIVKIKGNIGSTARSRSRQKSYADKRRKPLEFKIGDRVLLKIVECVGPVAYRLKLPQELSCVHDTVHVSNLKKCLAEPDVQVPLDEIEIDENLRFVEEPIEIVERDVKKLKRRRIPLVKVRWNSRQGAEYTWEREDQFQKKYPHLFSEPVPSSSAAT
ncbi:putative reverse transcriptase domain-containing protein [Tanacetum coccineum]